MTYCFDLDNTLCTTHGNDYENSVPIQHNIDTVNSLQQDGNKIIIFTARGMTTCNGDIHKVYSLHFCKTYAQLKSWGLEEFELIMGKPSAEVFVDDRAVSDKDFFKGRKRGVVIGNFDVLHPGYIKLFQECKSHCDHLTVALHEDPSINRKEKLKPILSVQERTAALYELRSVDAVIPYKDESELYEVLMNEEFDVRFMGEEYKEIFYTGKALNTPVHFIKRDHGWSTTKFKNLIYESVKN